MERLKAITKFLWIPIAGFALWLVYKFIFANDEDKPLDITSGASGLSSADVELYNKVYTLLQNGGDPYSAWNLLQPLNGAEYAKLSVELGNALNNVQDKPKFAYVFAKKNNTLLTTKIIEVYGNKVYQLVSANVTNFSEFIL